MLKILDLIESKEIPSSEMAVVIGGWGMRYEAFAWKPRVIEGSLFGDLK
jgi:hypothetical protein